MKHVNVLRLVTVQFLLSDLQQDMKFLYMYFHPASNFLGVSQYNYYCMYNVRSLRFGELAKSYEFVITAARHYWNAVIPLVNEPLERQLLKEPLQVVLQCLAAVTDKNIGKSEEVSSCYTLRSS